MLTSLRNDFGNRLMEEAHTSETGRIEVSSQFGGNGFGNTLVDGAHASQVDRFEMCSRLRGKVLGPRS